MNKKQQHIRPRDPIMKLLFTWAQGADSIKIYHLTSIGHPIGDIRRSYDRLISTMGFPILARWHLYIESGPRSYCHQKALRLAALSIDSLRSCHFNSCRWAASYGEIQSTRSPSGGEDRIFRDNYVNTVGVHALAHCVTKSSAAMILTVYDKH